MFEVYVGPHRPVLRLNHGLHLCYCTNVHPGEDWARTFDSLNRWTLQVRRQVGSDEPWGIGLRLSDAASSELSEPATLLAFQRWLDQNGCYVFTLNGFPFGRFHGAGVKTKVYLPDWTDSVRVNYTMRLFDLLAQLLPQDAGGSVSTLPGSFKEFIHSPEQTRLIRANLWRCVEHLARLSDRTGRRLQLGLEPEPLCLLENSIDTVRFFDEIREEHPGDPRLEGYSGVTYDTCHFAVEYETPSEVLARFWEHHIPVVKVQISNALKLRPDASSLRQLPAFDDDTYLHQVIIRHASGGLERFSDLGSPWQNRQSESTQTRNGAFTSIFHCIRRLPRDWIQRPITSWIC